LMKVSTLKRNPSNPRQIKADKLELLKKSVGSFQKMMELRPIVVDEKNVVLGGNMRLAAIKSLGLKDIPDTWVKRADDLTEDEKREFIIKDNNAFGEYDWDVLANEWSDLPLTEWGVDMPDFEAVDEEGDADAEPQMDKAAELNKKWKVKSGDLWQIGPHRLICGDSTSPQAVERVLDGAKPNLMVTDPPYGVDYEPIWREEALGTAVRRAGVVANDDRSDWREAWQLFPGNVAYCWAAMLTAHSVLTSFVESDFIVRAEIVWAKPHLPFGRGHYIPRHETCWYLVRDGATAEWIGEPMQNTLWELALDATADGGHGTQKPLECMARPIRNHEGDVYEPFAGSGTTLVASQNLNRKCYAIEISENYCAVILERMQTAFPDLEIKRIEEAASANA
jgi:DNA modification methylase